MHYSELYKDKNLSYYSHSRPELLQFLPTKLDIVLDVGCASGNFGKMLKEIYNCEVWGIEPDKNSAVLAEEKIDVVLNSIFDSNVAIPNHVKFDFIFFNDVLEHLQRPEEALILAKKYLKDDGFILASIPNLRFYPVMLSILRYKDFKYLDSGVMDKTHLRFFTQKSMQRLFLENGFKIKTMQGINKHKFTYLNILNFFTLNFVEDMKYPQFAIVVSKNI